MSRFCGRCGSMLDATAWNAGRCPHCGAEIEISGSEPGSGADAAADTATRRSVAPDTGYDADALAAAGMPLSRAGTTPVQPSTDSMPVNAGGLRDAPRPRRAPSPWMLALIAMLVVALVGVSVYALTSPRGVSIILAPFTASGASASSDSSSSASSSGGGSGGTGAQGSATRATNPGGSAAPTSAASPVGTGTIVPSPNGTATVSPTAVPVGTGTVVPMATATATPAQAALSVSPPGTPAPLVGCLLGGAQTQFIVANSGGQPLAWSASDNGNGYTITPGGSTVDAGRSTQVTVSHITQSGSVTFSAPGAQNSPQTVTITCKLLG